MSRPITWQNVNAPTSDPIQAMALAQGSFKNAFSGLSDSIKQVENTSEANWKQVRDNNTQAFLNEIGKYRTPEEYAAAVNSGALDSMRQGFGAQLDQAAARAAQDGRISILQDRALKANQFQDSILAHDQKPIKEQVAALYAAGKTQEGDALLAAHPDITDTAGLIKDGYAGREALIKRNLADTLRPGSEANAVASQGLETQKLAEEKRVADQHVLDVALNKRLLEEASNYSTQQQAMGKEMGKVAAMNGFPVDAQGMPKFSELTSAQAKSLDEILFAKKLPSISTFTTGDTNAADALKEKLFKEGVFPKSYLESKVPEIRSSVDSNKNSGNVGNTADARKVANAQEDAVMERMSKSTWSVPGTPNALRNQNDIQTAIKELVPSDYHTLANRAIQHILTKGVRLKDGSYEVPSLEDIKGELASTNDNLWDVQGWSLQGGDFADKLVRNLQDRMNSSNFTEQRKNRTLVDVYNLRKTASENYAKPPVVTPFNK